nr:uncharacterized protein DDB_G0283697-like [Onthophagus taurus]
MARYQHYQRRYKGYSDLRNFLDDKHQRGEEPNSAPCDPPSLLRDPLRGDNLQNYNRLPRNDIYRGRGRFQRRPNYNANYTRPRGYNNNPRGYNTSRGHPSRLPTNPTNIKIEFSTESGERKYQIEPENDISDKFNAGDRGRGGTNYRNRYGGYRHGRGHRGYYYRRSKNDQKINSENSQNAPQEVDNKKVEDEENWDIPVHVEEQNQKELDLKEDVINKLEEYHDDRDDTLYVEGEYLDEDEYYEEDEVQENVIEVQSELEEKEKIEDTKSEEKVEEKTDEEKLGLESESNKNNDDKNDVKTNSKDDLIVTEALKESKCDTKDAKGSQDESKDSKHDCKSPDVSENKKEIESNKN